MPQWIYARYCFIMWSEENFAIEVCLWEATGKYGQREQIKWPNFCPSMNCLTFTLTNRKRLMIFLFVKFALNIFIDMLVFANLTCWSSKSVGTSADLVDAINLNLRELPIWSVFLFYSLLSGLYCFVIFSLCYILSFMLYMLFLWII